MKKSYKLRGFAAAALAGTAMVVAPVVASATPTHVDHPTVSHSVKSPVANNLDTKLTIVNDTIWPVAVWMGGGVAGSIPSQISVIYNNQSVSYQDYSSLSEYDVQATVDFSGSYLMPSSNQINIQSGNPVIGNPKIHLNGFGIDHLGEGESATHTITTADGKEHVIKFERQSDLPDAKNMVAHIES